jgi:hypothetical protein
VRGRDEKGEAVGFAVNIKRNKYNQKSGLIDRVACTHCGKSSHDVTKCFEIIGYPESWGRGVCGGRGGRSGVRGRGRGRTFVNAVQAENNSSQHNVGENSKSKFSGLTDAQMKQIIAIISQSNVSTSTGSDEKLHGKISKTDWLLDSGASHHMTGDLKRLQCVYQIPYVSVVLPNGDYTVVKQEGSVVLDEIVLNIVLYVPNLNCNLISSSKLIKDSDCFITFTNEWCVI